MIRIPENTRRVVVRVRHSKAPSNGTNETKTLTLKGVWLCQAVCDDYEKLISDLESVFGPATFACSELPRALLSCFLVTGAENIARDSRLNLLISVTKAPAPAGSQHANLYSHLKEKMSVLEIIKMVAMDNTLLGNQPVQETMASNMEFTRNFADESNLVVTFDHEPAISVFAANAGLDANSLGLSECQACIFYLDSARKIVGVQKFMPTATLV